jgi:hypothetical protein
MEPSENPNVPDIVQDDELNTPPVSPSVSPSVSPLSTPPITPTTADTNEDITSIHNIDIESEVNKRRKKMTPLINPEKDRCVMMGGGTHRNKRKQTVLSVRHKNRSSRTRNKRKSTLSSRRRKRNLSSKRHRKPTKHSPSRKRPRKPTYY